MAGHHIQPYAFKLRREESEGNCNSWLPNIQVTRVAIETGTNDFQLNNLAIVNVQLFLTNLFQKVTIQKGSLCTSHATWCGRRIQ